MNFILNPGALDTNRKGRLTLLQVIGLVPWVLFGAFVFAPGAGMFGWFIYSQITQTFEGNLLFGLIFSVGFGSILIWFGYIIGGKLLIDMILGRVLQIDGQGLKFSSAGGTSGGKSYYYSVGEINFPIPSYSTYKRLHDANIVRAYYLPRSKTLVNLESNYLQPSTSRGFNRLEKAEREARK